MIPKKPAPDTRSGWIPVFGKRSLLRDKLERDDDSMKCHLARATALSFEPHGFCVSFSGEIGHSLVQRRAIIGFLTAAAVGNLVLWLSQPRTTSARPDPADHRPIAERLASQKVSSGADLPRAAAAAGLTLSRRTLGRVEKLGRVDASLVTISGWFADRYGDATPLTVVVFVAGTMVATTRTEGELPRVTRMVGLSFGAEKNTRYQMSFPCGVGEHPIVVGLGPKDEYVPLVLDYSVPPQCP
jgi:hypothetical protein